MSDGLNSKILELFECPKTGSALSFSKDKKALMNDSKDIVAIFERGVWVFALHSESRHEKALEYLFHLQSYYVFCFYIVLAQ